MRRYFTPLRTAALLALLVLSASAWQCNKSDERTLLKAEDDAAVAIEKLEKVRTDLLLAGKITAADANRIDHHLLRINTAVKRVSKNTDAFFAQPALGDKPVHDALAELRAAIDDTKTAVDDGTLGIKNADSQRSIKAFLSTVQSLSGVVENIVTSFQKQRGK